MTGSLSYSTTKYLQGEFQNEEASHVSVCHGPCAVTLVRVFRPGRRGLIAGHVKGQNVGYVKRQRHEEGREGREEGREEESQERQESNERGEEGRNEEGRSTQAVSCALQFLCAPAQAGAFLLSASYLKKAAPSELDS